MQNIRFFVFRLIPLATSALVFFALILPPNFRMAAEAQNAKKQKNTAVASKPIVRDESCSGVWMGPFVFNDPNLIGKLVNPYAERPLGQVPLDLNLYTCLTVSTNKDRHVVSGSVRAVLKNRTQTIGPLSAAFGKYRAKCPLVAIWPFDFWPAADIYDPKIELAPPKSDKEKYVEGAIAMFSAHLKVGGYSSPSTVLNEVASLNIKVPIIREVNGKELILRTGWIEPTDIKFKSRFWDRLRRVLFDDERVKAIANRFIESKKAELPESYALGLTKLSLTLIESNFANKDDKDLNLSANFSFDAPESVLKAVLFDEKPKQEEKKKEDC